MRLDRSRIYNYSFSSIASIHRVPFRCFILCLWSSSGWCRFNFPRFCRALSVCFCSQSLSSSSSGGVERCVFFFRILLRSLGYGVCNVLFVFFFCVLVVR